MPTIVPNLWFDTEAFDAAEHYTKIFPNSEIRSVSHYTEVGPRDAGMVLTVDFTLDGQPFTAINGGPDFPFTEAVSFLVECDDQAELDRYWEALGEGGEEVQCGWLRDRFGLSWQICPREMAELLASDDSERLDRVMRAMMPMVKLDIAALRAAAAGE